MPIKAALLPLIREWQERDRAAGIPYVVSYKGEPVTQIRHAWKCALKKAGIMRHIRPYDLRHGFATVQRHLDWKLREAEYSGT